MIWAFCKTTNSLCFIVFKSHEKAIRTNTHTHPFIWIFDFHQSNTSFVRCRKSYFFNTRTMNWSAILIFMPIQRATRAPFVRRHEAPCIYIPFVCYCARAVCKHKHNTHTNSRTLSHSHTSPFIVGSNHLCRGKEKCVTWRGHKYGRTHSRAPSVVLSMSTKDCQWREILYKRSSNLIHLINPFSFRLSKKLHIAKMASWPTCCVIRHARLDIDTLFQFIIHALSAKHSEFNSRAHLVTFVVSPIFFFQWTPPCSWY